MSLAADGSDGVTNGTKIGGGARQAILIGHRGTMSFKTQDLMDHCMMRIRAQRTVSCGYLLKSASLLRGMVNG